MKKSLVIAASILALSACDSTQSPAPVSKYGGSEGVGSAGVHTVLPGDTVYKVAQHYHLPMRDIIVTNSLSAPYTLEVGYRIKLPPPREYKVRTNDTLYSIGRTFDVSVSQLAQMNKLSAPYTLEAGQVLRLPAPTPRPLAQPEGLSAGPTFERSAPEEAVSASVPSVEREVLAAPGQPQAQQTPPPAQVQQASTARAKIDDVPKRTGNGKFMRPVEGNVVSSYGPKADGLHNDGINIKSMRGAPVRAAENGVVVYTGNELKGYGNLVLIRHDDRYMTAYGHLDRTLIKRGDIVKRGQSIATVGSSGQVDTPQLHFEIRRGTEALNPEKYL